ncbi:DUF882 domain-containing protein [Vibrio hannami]|uniref:DUF882 domain-containing protein n=1 Tax=Vibrio hannami TaxID=2717094 RepID=UPI00240FB320|nr:DUF882 domain-containing protein [Vibrio hannami]MDG3088215.1 DUF882 domain-containing protein [Vibrio hannami]
MLSRRHFLKLTTGSVALASLSPLVSVASPYKSSEPKEISLSNLHTGEKLTTVYFDGKQFVEEALNDIDHIFRDFRKNEVMPIDRRLLVKLDAIQNKLGINKEIQLVSGYRSPATNTMLREKSTQVASKSTHTQGKALDFYFEGVDLKHIQKAALSLSAGGVGRYKHFVHIDTGRVRSW